MSLYIRQSDSKEVKQKVLDTLENFILVVAQENSDNNDELEILKARLDMYTSWFLKDFDHVIENTNDNV